MSAPTVTAKPSPGAPATEVPAGTSNDLPVAPPAAAPVAAAVASPVRVRRAPPLEPPFEDEIDPTWPVRARHLPGPGHPHAAGPATTSGAAHGHIPAPGAAHGHIPAAGPAQGHVPAGPGASAGTPMAQPGRGPRAQRPVTPRPARGPGEPGSTPPSGRPQPSPGVIAAQRFVHVCIEILNGHRAVSHLRAVTAPADLKRVTDQLVSRTNRTYLGRPGRTVTTPQRVRLHGLRMCEPRDGVVEVAAVLGYGVQTWAMAVRMERPADMWLCKLIQVI